MSLDLVNKVQLIFWAGLLVGGVVGALVKAWKGLVVGMATGALLAGMIGVSAAGYALYVYWRLTQAPQAAALNGHAKAAYDALVAGTVFGMFSVFVLLVGLNYLAQLVDLAAAARGSAAVEPGGTMRAGVSLSVKGVSILIFLGAFGWMIVGPGNALANTGTTFGLIALAGLGFTLAALINPAESWSQAATNLGLAVGFGMFWIFIRYVVPLL